MAARPRRSYYPTYRPRRVGRRVSVQCQRLVKKQKESPPEVAQLSGLLSALKVRVEVSKESTLDGTVDGWLSGGCALAAKTVGGVGDIRRFSQIYSRGNGRRRQDFETQPDDPSFEVAVS
jgi:hypothetical protein